MGLFEWAAAINPVAAIGNSFSFGGDYLLADRQNQQNKDAVKHSENFTREMWNATNAYNTPAAQVQRLRDAGLNPNLAYGQVADSKASMVSGPAPQRYERPQAPRIADYQQVVNMQEQNNLIRSQRAEVEQRAISAALDNQYKNYENQKLIDSGMLKSDQGTLGGLMKFLIRGLGGTPDRPGVLRRDFQDK